MFLMFSQHLIELESSKKLPFHWFRLQVKHWGKDQLFEFIDPLLLIDHHGKSTRLSMLKREQLVTIADQLRTLLYESSLLQEKHWLHVNQPLLRKKHEITVQVMNRYGISAELDGEWHIIKHSFRYFEFFKPIPSINRFHLIDVRNAVNDLFQHEKIRFVDLDSLHAWDEKIQRGDLQKQLLDYQNEWNLIYTMIQEIESLFEEFIEID